MVAAACRMIKNLDLGCRRVDVLSVIGVLLTLNRDLGKPVSLLDKPQNILFQCNKNT